MIDMNDQSDFVQNLFDYPAAVERYHNKDTSASFIHEDPTVTSMEALEATSGRKNWKLRHHKRVKKILKPDRKGFIGSNY